MEKIVVLGIGNRLMMDDGIGIYIVEELMRDGSHTELHYVVGESDIDYCIERINGATLVVIVDAVVLSKEPGEVTFMPLSTIKEKQPLNISPHNMHLFNVLDQEGEEVKAFLIAIEPNEIHFHIGLSQTLKQKFKQIHQNVKNEIVKRII